jgi:hypothetical protein
VIFLNVYRFVSLGFILCALVACQTLAEQDSIGWYQDRGAVYPRHDKLVICHGFGCAHRTAITLQRSDKDKLAEIMAKGAKSAKEERAQLAKAVMWFEKRAGPVVGSTNDIGGLDMANARVKGQMDCIDEATNTTSLMLAMEDMGLFKHHRVGRPVARGFLLDGRYPHATATLIETATNTAHAIDPWPYGNGENVDVMLLSKWFATWPGRS